MQVAEGAGQAAECVFGFVVVDVESGLAECAFSTEFVRFVDRRPAAHSMRQRVVCWVRNRPKETSRGTVHLSRTLPQLAPFKGKGLREC